MWLVIANLLQNQPKVLACLYANPVIPRNAVKIVVDCMETVLSESIGVFVKSSAQQFVDDLQNVKRMFTFFC